MYRSVERCTEQMQTKQVPEWMRKTVYTYAYFTKAFSTNLENNVNGPFLSINAWFDRDLNERFPPDVGREIIGKYKFHATHQGFTYAQVKTKIDDELFYLFDISPTDTNWFGNGCELSVVQHLIRRTECFLDADHPPAVLKYITDPFVQHAAAIVELKYVGMVLLSGQSAIYYPFADPHDVKNDPVHIERQKTAELLGAPVPLTRQLAMLLPPPPPSPV